MFAFFILPRKLHKNKLSCSILEISLTAEPLMKEQFGTAGFVLYKEVFLPKRLTFLYQKIIKIMMIMRLEFR